MYFNFQSLSQLLQLLFWTAAILTRDFFATGDVGKYMHLNPSKYMKISLTKPALHFPAAIYWHFSHRAEIQFSISWNSARFLYFCIHSFVFLYFPYIDISLADPKFNFRSPEIVKVLWYDRLHQLNMNGQENMFCLLQDIDFFKLYTQGLCVLVFFFFQEGIKVLWWSKASFVFSICICICKYICIC